jgi:tRNA 2-thiouridine synthesizing protein A
MLGGFPVVEKEIDLTGLYCPLPVIRAREEIDRIAVGDNLRILADDPAAEEDLKRWATRSGHEVVGSSKNGDVITVVVRRKK